MPHPSRAILDHFAALSDPREGWRVVYPLSEILLLVLCATLSGMEDFVEIRLWGEQRMEFLRRFLPYERGLPAHDTLNDVINALDADLFKACFSAWVETLRDDEPDIIAVDGKTSRRSHARGRGREPLHLVSAWASRQRLVLGQEATDVKSNEITAIPRLLERLDLTGALVTIDAMGTQSAIAETIVRRGGDYLLALKGNRPATYADVVCFFADPAITLHEAPFETVEADHGRIEQRRHSLCHDVAWLWSDRRYPDEPRFPHLAMIGMVETRTERGGTIAHERRYYLCSAKLDAKTFAAAVRAHWHIENRLHWVLDVVFPRRSRPPQDWRRPSKHGHRQAHGHEPRARPNRQAQPQGPPQTGQPQSRLSRKTRQSCAAVNLKRFPWAVAEELEVKLPFETKRTDEDIAAAAIHRLSWDTSVPTDAVKVRVEKGWLTLTGQVDWKYQKDAAHDDLRPLLPRASATDISADIKRALHRSYSFYQDNVSVSAMGGAVKLTGTVPTFDDKWVAANTAWCAPGVTGVQNDIAVV